MKSIFVTGDRHGDITSFSKEYYYEFKDELKNSDKKENFVIVCGDFGFIWSIDRNNKQEKFEIDVIEDKPFTTLFVDGNHENFDRLSHDFETVDFCGGKAHKIRGSIYHLMSALDFNDFTTYLESINKNVDFKKWYSGHVHLDKEFDSKHQSLYCDWVKIY